MTRSDRCDVLATPVGGEGTPWPTASFLGSERAVLLLLRFGWVGGDGLPRGARRGVVGRVGAGDEVGLVSADEHADPVGWSPSTGKGARGRGRVRDEILRQSAERDGDALSTSAGVVSAGRGTGPPLRGLRVESL